jgi:chromosome segregation ATPase
VSDNDSKTKPGDGSSTYRKEPEGGISPVYPERPDLTNPGVPHGGGEPSMMEPVFQIPLEQPESSFNRAPAASQETATPVQRELNQLQSQIDDISRVRTAEDLSSNQVDILRKYIALKEAEARDLKEQQKQYQTYVRKLTSEVQNLNHKVSETVAELETHKRRDDGSRVAAHEIEKRYREEIARIKNEYEDQIRRSGNVSAEYEELQRRREEWKDKVREDLKRIKLKERELENKYELLKRDTQALLDSKDKHVMELKRKNDALELEMEALEERLRAATLSVSAVASKKRRLIETLKLAINLLEQMDQIEIPDESKKAG